MPDEEYQPTFNDMQGFLTCQGWPGIHPIKFTDMNHFLVVRNFRIEIDITCIIVTDFISTVRRQLQKATYRIGKKTYL